MTGADSVLSASVDIVENMSRLAAHPLVSVAMITYNHEQYIRQALDSVLMQEVGFSYEFVIGEDKSTDRTREIVIEYQRRHPDKIRLRLARENLYSKGINPAWGVFAACRGQYIALCEGDDYWTDPRKLQKQVDVLEADGNLVGTYHPVRFVYEYDETGDFVARMSGKCKDPPRHLHDITAEDIAEGNRMATCSVVHRNLKLDSSLFRANVTGGDWLLWMALSASGRWRYLPDVMGSWRFHRGGIWSSLSTGDKLRCYVKQARVMDELFNRRYHDAFERGIHREISEAAKVFTGLRSDDGMDARDFDLVFKHEPDLTRRILTKSFLDCYWGQHKPVAFRLIPLIARHAPALLLSKSFIGCYRDYVRSGLRR